jgi:HK97 family phage major capsid protein
MTLEELIVKKVELVEAAKTLQASSGDDMTDEQLESIEDLLSSADDIQVEIDVAERKERIVSELKTRDKEMNESRTRRSTPDGSPEITDVRDTEVQDKPWATLAHQLRAVKATASGYVDRRLIRGMEDYEAAGFGHSAGVPTDGGFAIDSDFLPDFSQRVYDNGIVARMTRSLSITDNSNSVKIPMFNETSRADGSRWGGIRAYWVDEGVAPTASQSKLRLAEMSLEKLGVLTYFTDEQMEDSLSFVNAVLNIVPEELAFAKDEAIINGDGSAKPQGILNANAVVSVGKETGQAATTLVAENVENMYSRLWPRSLNTSVWFIHNDVWPQIFQFNHSVGTGGASMFIPAGTLSSAPAGTLLGRPIVPIEHCQTLGTKGDIYLADMSQYQMIDKGGVNSQSSIHVRFTTAENAFRWMLRTNGQLLWNAALTPLNGSNTLSPIVTLDARA